MTFWSILRQRCWGLVLVVAGVCVITFIISHLIPGDPARLLAGDRASNAIVENIRQQLGLDQPLYVQFYRYVSDLFHGDLGTSIRTGRPVLEELRIFFPATLELAFCALLLALLIGIPLGILSAVWRNRWLDHLVRLMAITGISTPAFWLGLGVIVLFYGHLQILPGGGRLDDWLDPPTHVTGFYQRMFTYHRRTQLGQLTFGQLGEVVVKIVGCDKAEYGIAEKLEPFIVLQMPHTLLVGVRRVGHRLAKQSRIAESVADSIL